MKLYRRQYRKPVVIEEERLASKSMARNQQRLPVMKKFVLWSLLCLRCLCERLAQLVAADVAGADRRDDVAHAQPCGVAERQRPVQIVYKTAQWDPKKTAIIICDMWDRHWCKSATARVAEMAPRMNDFVAEARKRGVLIVHAPSDCMGPTLTIRPAGEPKTRRRPTLPEFLKRSACWPRSRERSHWPIDQSDGGCDCTPPCAQVIAWRRQIDAIKIADEDAISDSGVEIGNLFVQRGIENVIFMGVHTNMCVVGRPFGLRNLVRFGKNVVLVRDLTDAMYNPRKAPHVSHFRGTELMVEYIEKYICPTITSSDLLGGPAFRFRQDKRPHVVLVSYEDEYHSAETLPRFAQELCDRYRLLLQLPAGREEDGHLRAGGTGDGRRVGPLRAASCVAQGADGHDPALPRRGEAAGGAADRQPCLRHQGQGAAGWRHGPRSTTRCWAATTTATAGRPSHGDSRRRQCGGASDPCRSAISHWTSPATLYNVSPIDPMPRCC